MNQQEFKSMGGGADAGRENSLRYMLGQFYNRKMQSIVLFVWFWALVFMAGAVVCAVMFFRSEEVKSLILYAVLFLMLIQWLGMMKIFAWMMIHRNSILEQIKQLRQSQA